MDFAQGYYQKNGQPTKTLDGIKAAIRAVKELYGHERVATFGPLCLLAIQQELVGTGVSRGYVNKQGAWIKRMFKWGVSRGLVPTTTRPYRAVDRGGAPQRPHHSTGAGADQAGRGRGD